MADDNPIPVGDGSPMPTEKSSQPIEVNLSSASSLSEFKAKLTKPVEREVTARKIGMTLILIFGGTVLLIVVEGFYVIIHSMGDPEKTKIIVSEAVIPFLEKVATFLTTVFSPLLAFILGYYFGQKQTDGKA